MLVHTFNSKHYSYMVVCSITLSIDVVMTQDGPKFHQSPPLLCNSSNFLFTSCFSCLNILVALGKNSLIIYTLPTKRSITMCW